MINSLMEKRRILLKQDRKLMARGKRKSEGVCCHYPGERAPRFIEPFLLLLLSEGPSHGYELLFKLKEMGLEYEAEDIGHVYRNLRRMERLGLIESEWAETGRRGKRIYSITEKGRKRLDEWALSIDYIKDSLQLFLHLYNELKKSS